MKTYRGIIKGNTAILEETPDVPDETEAIVSMIDRIKAERGRLMKNQRGHGYSRLSCL
jgi:hypothetical protein